LKTTFASRDKEAAVQALAFLQKQYDHLSSQQSHWDDLRRASEQIETLTTLIGQVDNEEIKELRRLRDHSKVVDAEHAALQKRFKDQESRAANSERAAVSARQNLAQAQQRSSEWELRAKEFQSKLELTQTKLDQADQTQVQLEADYSLVKLQLEEAEANDRLTKVSHFKILC
jgi:chromosome segregation ATPase